MIQFLNDKSGSLKLRRGFDCRAFRVRTLALGGSRLIPGGSKSTFRATTIQARISTSLEVSFFGAGEVDRFTLSNDENPLVRESNDVRVVNSVANFVRDRNALEVLRKRNVF